jgi:arylformamidase
MNRPPTLLDLSVPVVTGMPVYPGDPDVSVTPALRAPEDGVNVLRVHMGSQSGTHVDAPYHVEDSWPRLDELPLTRFSGPAVAADLRGLPPRAPIPVARLAPVLPRLAEGVVLLLVTGWSVHWGGEEYGAHPWLTAEAARAIVDTGVRTVAVDALSVDPTVDPAATQSESPGTDDGPPTGDAPLPTDSPLPAHRALCGAGAVIAENLTGLDRVVAAQSAGRPVELFLFPLNLVGADGAPVRAVARIG